MNVLHIDFETRSACDLRETGAEVYSRHPTTDVWCMAWALNDGPTPCYERELFERVSPNCDPLLHVRDGGLVYAHNAAFELTIWNNVMAPRYGWPELKAEQVRCTMAMAYAMGLPGSLDDCARALGLAEGKDQKGYRLMLQMSKPRRVEDDGAIVWWDDADKLERLYAYCKQDVEVERNIHKKLMELSTDEQNLWALDHRINQRGIQIDTQSVTAAVKVVEQEKKRLDGEMRRVTGGAVKACSEVKKLTEWVGQRGLDCSGLGKSDVVEMLLHPGLPDDVRDALRLRQEAGKSSTAKLTKMLACACPDGRVRGAFQYHGASTGRWAGRLVQFQNLPRGTHKPEEIGEIISLLSEDPEYLDLMYGPTLDAVSSAIRGFIVAPEGYRLMVGDFSAIEARVTAWLAGQQEVLDVFATGADIYCHAAAGIYGRHVTKEDKAERAIGKVAILALGFAGGVGAFQSMARIYNVKVPDEQAERIKVSWRQANPAIVQFWYDLERAAMRAVLGDGIYSAGYGERACKFRRVGDFLWCRLPSGRAICYPFPRVEIVQTPWGSDKDAVTHMGVNGVTRKWERQVATPGRFCENVVQAVARDVLAASITRLDSSGYPVVGHVHDEVICEVENNSGSLKEYSSIMAAAPLWAKGLPLAVEVYESTRYRK